jgi:hypothetical protein
MANLATAARAGHIEIAGRKSTPFASFIPTIVISNKNIGPGPKLIYSRLLAYAGANVPATNNKLAADLAISPRSVRNYIAALKAAGLVEVQHHPGKPRSFKLAAAF